MMSPEKMFEVKICESLDEGKDGCVNISFEYSSSVDRVESLPPPQNPLPKIALLKRLQGVKKLSTQKN